ncbi:MAG: hypothetical protein IKP82_08735 [Oscillospiraceae bacterium]|nr:hypothetical protein [Oscillospiraceae bacterium]
MDNDVLELIEMLYTMVTEAWGVPLGNEKCIVERDKVLNLLDEIRARLPSEFSEARRLVGTRDEMISSAKREADAIRRAAEERSAELVEQQEIVRAARNRSNELLTTAETRARELYRVANDYVDDALKRTEEAITAALNEVSKSRASFRSAAGVNKPAQNERARNINIET